MSSDRALLRQIDGSELFGVINEFSDAHEHLDRAQVLFTKLKDFVNLAQVDGTRARVMLAEGRIVEAERTARSAVGALERTNQKSLLAQALITHGTALARLAHPERALATLRRAGEVGADAGDPQIAAQAALAVIEELSSYLSRNELRDAVERAEILIDKTDDISILRRLAHSACRAFTSIHERPALPQKIDWSSFNLKRTVLEYEAHFIRLALTETQGARKRAAKLLGLKSHQSLLSLLKGRHQDLRDVPTPFAQRRRSIIRERENASKTIGD